MSILNRFVPTHFSHVNQYLTGVYYIPSQHAEPSLSYVIGGKIKHLAKCFDDRAQPHAAVSCGTVADLPIPADSVDYVFTDPPFGENIFYADLNFIVEAWHGIVTRSADEAIIDEAKGKAIDDYRDMMVACFKEYCRVLKPGRWITVVFHNSSNAVWNALQDALWRSGFVVASVLTLDKKHRSYRQETSDTVKNDLVINAYKPGPHMIDRFRAAAGTENSVWAFIDEHLRHAPPVATVGGRREAAAERTPLRLYDRMVTFHLQARQPVPMSRGEFVEALKPRYPLVDGMHFHPDQIPAYETDRRKHGMPAQMDLFINDERSAIRWLYTELDRQPRSIQDLLNPYKAAAQTWPQKENPIELKVLLEQNFLQYQADRPVPAKLLPQEDAVADDPTVMAMAKGLWYVPDPEDQAEMERQREVELWGEFQRYQQPGRKRFASARREAVRVGFSRLLERGEFQAIIDIAARLPEESVQEDDQITLLYDTARAIVGEV